MSGAPESEELARVAEALAKAGLEPVLIGGLALVVHGSTRATRDCDYALEKTESAMRRSVDALFEAGYGIILGWDEDAHAPMPDGVKADATAAAWARAEHPESVWFWNAAKETRIDLVFDLPVPIEDLRARSRPLSIAGRKIAVASLEDLLIMKETSVRSRRDRRKQLSDEQDIVYLKGLLGKREPGQ